MTTYHYQRLTTTAQCRVTCPICGKKRTVQRTFGQTVNPFHSKVAELDNPTYPEARAAVWEAVQAEAAAWKPSERESTHIACEKRNDR